MKKYIGSKMDIFCAVVYPLFIVGPIFFAFVALSSEISFATIFVAAMCFCCTVLCSVYLRKIYIQFYSWGVFRDDGIHIRSGLFKKYVLKYENCKSIGIGMYTHGILNSSVGSKVKYIFFSDEPFEEKYRLQINLWRPTTSRIKVGFHKELYDYLLTVLPKHQANSLKHDYEKYVKSLKLK